MSTTMWVKDKMYVVDEAVRTECERLLDLCDTLQEEKHLLQQLWVTVNLCCTPPDDCNDVKVLKDYMKACIKKADEYETFIDKGKQTMAKYKNIQELANAFKAGDLKDWVLMVDNDSTHLQWIGPSPKQPNEWLEGEAEDFEDAKYDEGKRLWASPDVYILDQALLAAGIPNEGV